MGELHFLIVHPIEKFHSTMFTPSTFPKSPTFTNIAKRFIQGTTLGISVANSGGSASKVKASNHVSLTLISRKKNVFDAMWSESMPTM